MIIDELNMTEILILLRDGRIPIQNIPEFIGVSSSKMSRLLNNLIDKGLVNFDEGEKQFKFFRDERKSIYPRVKELEQ